MRNRLVSRSLMATNLGSGGSKYKSGCLFKYKTEWWWHVRSTMVHGGGAINKNETHGRGEDKEEVREKS